MPSKITKGVIEGGIRYYKFRLGKAEQVRCNGCKKLIHCRTSNVEDQPIMILREAIRSDDALDETRCEECAKKDWHVAIDRKNRCLQVERP